MWSLLFVLLSLPVLIFLYLELKHFRVKRILSVFPGAPTLPLVGNAHQIGKTPADLLNQLFDWWNEFGRGNYIFWIGYYPNIIITNPNDLQFILSSNTLIDKSDIYHMLHPWLGLGLLTSTGTKWRKHRKIITPSFHFNILQDFHEVMNRNSTKFVSYLKQIAAADNIFDFQDSTHYLTLDIICETAMGVSVNAIDNKDSDLVRAFKDMCSNISMRSVHPWKRSNTLFKLSSDYSGFKRTLNVLQNFTNKVIEKRIAARQKDTEHIADNDEFGSRKLAFLDTLLTSTIDGRPLNQQEIYEEVSTFIFEGHDTTTSGISFSVYLLSRFADVQNKVYEEQKAIMGNSLQRDATFQELSEMKYLDLFLKEQQRVYPSVPNIARLTEKDYNINGTIVPKGTTLNIFLMALGYNKQVFEDPHLFKPERFNTEKPGPYEYLPFSAGPRNCIGQKFAMLELKTIVSKIVRTFEVLPAVDEIASRNSYINTYVSLPKAEQMKLGQTGHKYDPILGSVLTLRSENGLYIRLRERKLNKF